MQKTKLIAVVAVVACVLVATVFIGAAMLNQESNIPTDSGANPASPSTNSPSPIDTTSTPTPTEYTNAKHILLQTSMGNITIELRNDMPITTGNFINLAQAGKYDGTIFHRVIAGFMIQGGDPTGTGYGDPSIPNIPDEYTATNHNYNGTIAMANTGQPNSGSSQFFINVADNNRYSDFDSSYPAFGQVVSGMDVVMAISRVPTGANDKPLYDITLISATVLP